MKKGTKSAFPQLSELLELQRRANGATRQRVLAEGRKALEAGDRAQILYVLDYCLARDTAIPDWLKQAFREAYDAPRRDPEVKTWDKVFGPPRRKHSRAEIENNRPRLAALIYWAVEARRNANEPTDEGLFESVGAELGLSIKRSTINKLYYAFKNALDVIDPKRRLWLKFKPSPDLPAPHPAVRLPDSFTN